MLSLRSLSLAAFAVVVSAETDANGALEAETVAAEVDAEKTTKSEDNSPVVVEKPTLTGKVLVGKGDNYDQWITQFKFALVEFMAPWCGHCKKLEPEYAKAAEMLHAEGIEIPLIAVDATAEENKTSVDKYAIQGFPTLKWFVNGTPTDFDGPREAQGIVDWIKNMTGPAVVEGEAKGDEKLSVTFFGEDAGLFEEVAAANRKRAKWFHVKGSESKIVLKHVGEEGVETTSISTQEEIETFFKDNSLPKFGELNGDTFADYLDAGKGLLWALPKFSDKEKVKEEIESMRDMYMKAAAEIGPEYSVAWVNTIEFAQIMDNMFGLKPEDLPTAVAQTKAGDTKNYLFSGAFPRADAADATDYTGENLAAFVAKVKAGEIQPHLKSEAVPSEEELAADPVKKVVGKTLKSMVFTEVKDVLLEVYAPWCGHCKKLEPEYQKVAKKVEKEGFADIITIAKIDGTQNDSPVDSISWTGFPTMFYVKAGSTEAVKYTGARDAKGIWKWIKKNHSQADAIKERLAANKAAKKAEKPAEKEEL